MFCVHVSGLQERADLREEEASLQHQQTEPAHRRRPGRRYRHTTSLSMLSRFKRVETSTLLAVCVSVCVIMCVSSVC